MRTKTNAERRLIREESRVRPRTLPDFRDFHRRIYTRARADLYMYTYMYLRSPPRHSRKLREEATGSSDSRQRSPNFVAGFSR